MKKELQTFNFNQYTVRTDVKDEQVWFCLKDVCDILDIKDRRQVRVRLNQRGMYQIPTPTSGGLQKTYYINESNLYRVILKSDKKEAIEFENWVCEEVLPSLRKNGSYSMGENLVEVKEHRRRLPSGKKEIVLAEKEHKTIGGIVKSCVGSVLDDKLGKVFDENGEVLFTFIKLACKEAVREEFALDKKYPAQDWRLTAHHAIDELCCQMRKMKEQQNEAVKLLK